MTAIWTRTTGVSGNREDASDRWTKLFNRVGFANWALDEEQSRYVPPVYLFYDNLLRGEVLMAFPCSCSSSLTWLLHKSGPP